MVVAVGNAPTSTQCQCVVLLLYYATVNLAQTLRVELSYLPLQGSAEMTPLAQSAKLVSSSGIEPESKRS